VRNKIDNQSRLVGIILAGLSIFLAACGNRGHAVSGTIEVDEAHVGPRAGGRVEKILAWEGDHLHEGQLIAQLDASELRARRGLLRAWCALPDHLFHRADAGNHSARRTFFGILAEPRGADRDVDLAFRSLRVAVPKEDCVAWCTLT
jgi:hypothetical protein